MENFQNFQRTTIIQTKNPITKGTMAQVELQPCPVFQGRHKWSILACKLDKGTVRYCQFCYLEKLIPFAYNALTEYHNAGTYFCR